MENFVLHTFWVLRLNKLNKYHLVIINRKQCYIIFIKNKHPKSLILLNFPWKINIWLCYDRCWFVSYDFMVNGDAFTFWHFHVAGNFNFWLNIFTTVEPSTYYVTCLGREKTDGFDTFTVIVYYTTTYT